MHGPNCVEVGGPQFDFADEVELAAIVCIASMVSPIVPWQPTRDVETVVLVESVMSQPE